MSIEILSSEVVDQIAAGEVVERPAHMVKELIENSIDAGATEISVEYSQGGRSVRIIDNGSGMGPQDLPKAFLRFATSKIKDSEDLWRLSSFGFRGEALASIGSVSKLTVFSSDTESGMGHRITCEAGKLGPLEPVSRSRGTTIIVENLFQNVPARLKFMKGEAAEAAQIKQMVKALALAHPSIDFRVTQEGKLLYYWPSTTDMKKRVESILEITPLYEGSSVRGRVKARAFFSDPHQVARVSKNLWFFAQNRYVQDRSLQAAVMEAYRHLLMHGEYPYVVCFLETDPSDIDVNIHPTKSQVKFLNPQEAFRAVQGAIRSVLEKAPWLHQNQEESIGVQYQEGPSLEKQQESGALVSSSGVILRSPLPVNLEFEDPAFKTTVFRQKNQEDESIFSDILRAPAAGLNPSSLFQDKVGALGQSSLHSTSHINAPSQGHASSPAHHQTQAPSFGHIPTSLQENAATSTSLNNSSSSSFTPSPETPLAPKPMIRHWSLLQIIGQAGLTYLVCQSEKGLVLIDQHAAHERVAFERLMNAWKKGIFLPIQTFLFPLSIDLSEEKVEALRPYFEEFAKMGIEIEELGPITLGVKSAPQLLKDKILVEEIERMATEVTQWGDSQVFEKAIGEICARLACHSVLRAGQSLSRAEMAKLLEEMDEHPLSSFCPHGRPVSLTYSWAELEKDFGRRV